MVHAGLESNRLKINYGINEMFHALVKPQLDSESNLCLHNIFKEHQNKKNEN